MTQILNSTPIEMYILSIFKAQMHEYLAKISACFAQPL